MASLLIHIATWVVILVLAHLIVRKILNDGWRSLFRPFSWIVPRRSSKGDPSVWEHLDKE